MKLPIIKHLSQFIEQNDQDYLVEAIDVLEALTEVSTLKDEELDVIGELISNMYESALNIIIRVTFIMIYIFLFTYRYVFY